MLIPGETNQIGELMRRSTFDDTAPGRVILARFRSVRTLLGTPTPARFHAGFRGP